MRAFQNSPSKLVHKRTPRLDGLAGAQALRHAKMLARARRIRDYIAEQGCTQRAAAEAFGLKEADVSRLLGKLR